MANRSKPEVKETQVEGRLIYDAVINDSVVNVQRLDDYLDTSYVPSGLPSYLLAVVLIPLGALIGALVGLLIVRLI